MALPKVGVEAVIEGMGTFEADTKKVNQAYNDMDTGANKLGKSSFNLTGMLTGLGASILNIGAVAGGAALVGVTALGAGLATFAIGGIKQAIDLDQQVANIAATMGATKETAGTLKDELKGLALDLSLNPNLTVDVTQAGQAIEVLAANGALATDEFGKLTEASKDLAVQTVALANATGSDFATAATIATDAMALFGLKTDEMGKAVDGAAGIMNASKFSAQDYQLALSNAGGIAAEMGISIEDFNTVLAGTASNFASGSDAGTSFKTLMQRLANPTDEVKAAMEQYGISLFDAEGNMRNMADVAQDLNQVFNGTVTVTSQVGGATKEQAKAAEQASSKISDLTRDIGRNNEALGFMQTDLNELIVKHGAESEQVQKKKFQINKLTDTITDQNEKLADYKGAISAVDGAQARTVTSTQELTEAQKAQLAATLGGADGSRILLGLADMTAAEFDTLSESVNRTGQGMEAAALRVDTVKGAMDIFKGVLQAIQIQVGDKFLPLLKDMAVQFTQFATNIGPQVVAFFGQVSDSIGQIITRGQELFTIFQAEGGGGLLTALGIDPAGIELFGKVSTLITDIATSISSVLTPALSSLSSGGIIDNINIGLTFLNEHFEEFKGALLGIGAVIAGGMFAALVAGVLSLLTPINLIIAGAALLGAAWAGNWFGIRDTLTNVWNTVYPILTDLWTWLNTNIPVAIQTVSDIWTNTLLPGFTRIYETISSEVLPALQNLFDTFTSGTGGTQTLSDLWTNTLQPALATVGDFLVNTLFPAWVELEVFLAGALATAIQLLADYWENYLFPAMSKVGDAVGVMSDLWKNTLLPALEKTAETLQPLQDLFISFNELGIAVVNKSSQALAGLWQNVLWPALQKVGKILKDTLMPAFTSIGSTVKSDVSPVLKDLGDTIFPLLQEGLDFVTESIKDLIGYFDSLKATVNSFTLPDILTPGSPPPMAYALWDIGKGADAAAQAIGGMGNAMAGVNPKDFLDAMNVGGQMHALGASNVNDLKDIFKLNSQSVMDILGSGGGQNELNALLQQQAQVWNIPPQFATQLAEANGLFTQLIDQYGEFARATRLENLGRLTQMATSFAGLGSTFAGMLEEQMAGADAAKKAVEEYQLAIGKLTTTEGANQIAVDKKNLAIEKASEALSFGERQMAIYQQELATLMLDEEGNALQIEKKVLQMDKLTESMDAQSKTMSTLQDELNKLTGDMEKNQAAVAKAEKSYKELQAQAFDLFSGNQTDAQQIDSEIATIALLEDFLKSGAASFLIPADAVSQAAGITGILYDQISGQQELNRLLAEQSRREELITAQKEAQQKLDFLKSQLDLINLGRELGGNIFAGMTFGLNASVEDLLAATNNVVEAMVSQINSDLQIASPSKVMMRIGQQMMAGLQGGIASMTPVLNSQLSASVMGPLSPSMAGAMNSGSYSTTNNFNVGGNNISNGMQAAEFESRVLQVIRRNL